MKYDVHLFAVVRVKCPALRPKATMPPQRSHGAIPGAVRPVRYPELPAAADGVTDVEFGEEFSHFLVDDAGRRVQRLDLA